MLKLNLKVHEDNVDEPTNVDDTTNVDEPNPEPEVEIPDNDAGFIKWMKGVFAGEQKADEPKQEEESKQEPDKDEQSELAIKYKNRYKEKYANEVAEANKAKEITDLKLTLATARADGRPFDVKYLDFAAQEIAKSGKTAEEWLKDNTQYFEKQAAGNPVVRTNVQPNSQEKEYQEFLERQRR